MKIQILKEHCRKIIYPGLAILFLLAGKSDIYGQGKYNYELKKELDSLYAEDQKFRNIFSQPPAFYNEKKDSLAKVFGVQIKDLYNFLMKKYVETDSDNIKRIAWIIEQFGYPGKSLVGEPSNEAAFISFNIQHR